MKKIKSRFIFCYKLNIQIIFLCFLFSTLSFLAYASEVKNSKRLTSVEVQWEEEKNISKYQVQIFNSKNKFIKSFESKTSLFKFKSTSGKIKLKGRYVDNYGNIGPWSSFIEIDVPPDSVKFNFPSETGESLIKAQASNQTLRGKVNLAWPSATQAKKYKLRIYDSDKKLIKELVTDNLTEKIELETGVYQFSITALGNDLIPSKETYSPQKIMIGAAQLNQPKFEIVKDKNSTTVFLIKIPQENWESKKSSIYGELEYSKHFSDQWAVVKSFKSIKDKTWSYQKIKKENHLIPGKYRISLWLSKKDWIDSEKFKYEFIIKPTQSELENITNSY